MSIDLGHGGALDQIAARFPGARTPWVDLSTGINPWPWPVPQLDPAALHRLPTQGDSDRCSAAMLAALSAPSEALLLVPGTEIAIRLLPHCLDARRIAVLAPSYRDHAESWQSAGADVIETRDPLTFADTADVVIVCNPNNPDGRRFRREDLIDAWTALRARGRWLIVDEAFADLEPQHSLAPLTGGPGLVLLRSSGKFFGLAGLRLGALLGPPSLTAVMRQLLGVWRVSTLALTIGAGAYADLEWQGQTRERLAEARVQLDQALQEQGVRSVGGTDLFRFVEVKDAHGTWNRLCNQGVYTRRFSWTDRHLRIGLPADQTALHRLRTALSLQDQR
ncbi:MAG: threonine-phosphate decarboxylase CobD [Pseudomonadota bacterium]